MKNSFVFILILALTSIQAQNSVESKTDIKADPSKVKSIFYDDGILAKIIWYGSDSRADSLKTYYASGNLNEVFYHDDVGRFLKGKQYNTDGKLLTTWDFQNGKLLKRSDHRLSYNTKNKAIIEKAQSTITSSNEKLLKNPDDFNSFYARAIARYILGNYTLALKDFKMLEGKIEEIVKDKNIIGPNKTQAAVYDYLAGIYESYEMENHTIHYKIKAISTSPKESRLYYNLGAYLTKIEAYDISISYLNKAIAMVPKHGFAQWLLAIAYSDLGENEKAMKNINIAFQHEDGIYRRSQGTAERDLRTTRGLLYHRMGASKKGIADLKEALRINKNNSFALRNLGVIYHDLGQYSKACEVLTKAKDLAYESVHDKADLQVYLDNACNNTHSDFETVKLAPQLLVYPNPTQDVAYIKNLDIETFEYNIYDFESKLIKQSVSNNKAMDFSNLPTGLYIVKITVNNEIHSFRVIKE